MTGLVKDVEKVIAGSPKADKKKTGDHGVLIYLTDDDKKKVAEKLEDLAKKNGIEHVALTINKSGAKSPKSYKLNDKVKHTILVYEKKKVVHNFALDKITEKEKKEIIEAAKKVLKPKAILSS